MFGTTLPLGIVEPTYTVDPYPFAPSEPFSVPVTVPPYWPNPTPPPLPDQIKDEMIRFLMDENKRLREELERERKR